MRSQNSKIRLFLEGSRPSFDTFLTFSAAHQSRGFSSAKKLVIFIDSPRELFATRPVVRLAHTPGRATRAQMDRRPVRRLFDIQRWRQLVVLSAGVPGPECSARDKTGNR